MAELNDGKRHTVASRIRDGELEEAVVDGEVVDDPRPVIEALAEAVINTSKHVAMLERKQGDLETQVAQTLKLMSKILKMLEADDD